MKGKILIIPDVHGRTFWKKALDTGEYEKVIFLGDYVDPYEFDGITSEVALDNFKSIIAYKNKTRIKWFYCWAIMIYITFLSFIMNWPGVADIISC